MTWRALSISPYPKACVGPLSAELVKSLFASSGGGDHIGGGGGGAAGSAGVLSDLLHNVEKWSNSHKSFFGNVAGGLWLRFV